MRRSLWGKKDVLILGDKIAKIEEAGGCRRFRFFYRRM